METIILTIMVVFEGLLLVWYIRESNKERQELINALIAKNLNDYTISKKQLSMSVKDKLKQIKAENELALKNAEMIKKQGIPIT